jgi:predicted transcriptional regulator
MRSKTDKNDTYTSILSIAKQGASKKELAESLSMSEQQLRRLTAELVDQGMLRLDANRVFVTTDKGHIFLQNKK